VRRGADAEGRAVLALVGRALPPFDGALDAGRLARFVYAQLAALLADSGGADFVLVYYHSGVTEAGRARVAWLWDAFEALPDRVRERLAALHVLHGVATLRGALALLPFALCAPFASAGLSHKVHYAESLAELYRHGLAPEQLQPPRFVLDADAELAREKAAPVPRAQVKAERMAALDYSAGS
jgi:hypothetical protein